MKTTEKAMEATALWDLTSHEMTSQKKKTITVTSNHTSVSATQYWLLQKILIVKFSANY